MGWLTSIKLPKVKLVTKEKLWCIRRICCLQVLYALTAGIAGYVAAVTYKILGGSSWVRNTLLTATLFCGPLLVTFSFLNTVAIIYRSTAALPFGTIVIIFVIWAVVTFPLTVLGGIAGKNTKVSYTSQRQRGSNL